MPQHDKQPRFVWPPPKPKAGPSSRPPADAVHTADLRRDPPTSPATSPRRPAQAPRLADWLWDIERTWLGVHAAPLQRRLQAHNLSPDPGDVYCWRCGHAIGPMESDARGCARCRPLRLPWHETVRLGAYGGLWRRCVLEVKFQRFGALGTSLGRELGRQVSQRLTDQGLNPRDAIIVPVPTSLTRRLARGIDHPLWLARGVASVTGGTLWQALSRQNRPAQALLPKSSREENLRGAFTPSQHVRIAAALKRTANAYPNPTAPAPKFLKFFCRRCVPRALNDRLGRPGLVVLVDDVTTTGATALTASKAFNQAWKALSDQELRTVLGVVAVTGRTRRAEQPASDDGRDDGDSAEGSRT